MGHTAAHTHSILQHLTPYLVIMHTHNSTVIGEFTADNDHMNRWALGLISEGMCSGRETGVDTQHLLALAPSTKRPKTADQGKGKDALR